MPCQATVVKAKVETWLCGTALGRMAGSHSVTQRGRGALAKWIPVGEISIFL